MKAIKPINSNLYVHLPQLNLSSSEDFSSENKTINNNNKETFQSPLNSSRKLKLTIPSQKSSSAHSQNHSYALHQAIMDGRVTQVTYFLEMGLSANQLDKYGRSCLMIACLSDHIEYGIKVTKLLLKYGADLNARDTLGRTVLYMACSEDRAKLFDLLVAQHSMTIDWRQADNDGNSLLNHVCACGTTKMVERVVGKMIERGVECDQRNRLGYTALLLAIKNDRFLNALTVMKMNAAVSVSIRDRERCMNAIEWLEYRVAVNRDKFESGSETVFRY